MLANLPLPPPRPHQPRCLTLCHAHAADQHVPRQHPPRLRRQARFHRLCLTVHALGRAHRGGRADPEGYRDVGVVSAAGRCGKERREGTEPGVDLSWVGGEAESVNHGEK